MPIWPFRKQVPEALSGEELRDLLLNTAVTGSRRRLRKVCRLYREQVAAHVDIICKMPDDLLTDDDSVDRYMHSLGAVAQCLAQECGAPELWDKLTENVSNNPLVKWDRWYRELPERMANLEYDELIDEVQRHIAEAKNLRGAAARQQEAVLHGRWGELLFHSGRAADAVKPFDAAYALCEQIGDTEGQVTYLKNLLEMHRYLDDGLALPTANRLLDLHKRCGTSPDEIRQRIQQLERGEPLCRIVCVHNGRTLELDEINSMHAGRIQFQFVRNRLSPQKATVLTEQGTKLGSAGELSAAMEKFQEASDVDPFDPAPRYHLGESLLRLGAYDQAQVAFEEVERLAPGWFRCRSDRWLAQGLAEGSISVDEFQVLRLLEDGGLDTDQALNIVEQAVERFPDFAPFYLELGDLRGKQQDKAGAQAAYRRGLELVEEPDLETRLLCALAGILPPDDPEKTQLINRAVEIDGNLVAKAMAHVISLRK